MHAAISLPNSRKISGNLNIIIVWPTGSVATSDSASDLVYVIDDTRINNESSLNILPSKATIPASFYGLHKSYRQQDIINFLTQIKSAVSAR